MPRASPRIRSSYVLTTRGVKPLLTSARSRVCARRVGVEHRLARLDLLRRQVLERRPAELGRVRLPVLRHLDDVVVARERPRSRGRSPPPARRAAPRGGAASARRTARPLSQRVEIGEVDVVERRALRARGRRWSRRGRPSRRRGPPARAPPRRLRAAARAAPGARRPRFEPRRSGAARAPAGKHVAGAKIELRRMARADDDVALELAVRERALLVGAGVLERDPAVGGAAEADGGALDLDAAEEADRASSAVRRRARRARSSSRLLERRRVARRFEPERLVERRDAVVLGGVRGGVVDLSRRSTTTIDEPDQRRRRSARSSSRRRPS